MIIMDQTPGEERCAIIRKARPDEAEKVLAFYHDLIDRMREHPYRPSWTKGVYPTLRDISDAAGREELFISEEEGSVIGAFILNHAQGEGYDRVDWTISAAPSETAVIHLLAVSPLVQGQGVGRALLQKAAEAGRSEGNAVIRLDTLPWNRPARSLYESFGFSYRGNVSLTYPSTGTIPFSMYEYLL